jgi:hypothetical protein
MEPRVQYYSPSEDENSTEELEVTFRARRAGHAPNVLDSTEPTDSLNRSAAAT